MDDVADLIQDSAETLKLYDVRKVNDEIARLTDLSVKCCERVKDAVALNGRPADAATAEAALKTCEEIDRLESDADHTQHQRRHHRGRLDPAPQRASAVRWGVAGNIVWAWVFTIPASGLVAAVAYWVSLAIF